MNVLRLISQLIGIETLRLTRLSKLVMWTCWACWPACLAGLLGLLACWPCWLAGLLASGPCWPPFFYLPLLPFASSFYFIKTPMWACFLSFLFFCFALVWFLFVSFQHYLSFSSSLVPRELLGLEGFSGMWAFWFSSGHFIFKY